MEHEKRQLVEELHKPARRNFPRRKVDIRGLDETWQADLVDMQAYARSNNGFKYLLTVIDIFSKYAQAVPLKSKTGVDQTAAFKSILDRGRTPKNLHVDQGGEFYNAKFEQLLKLRKIHLYSTYSTLKASIVERFNRTLKSKMWKYFSLRGSYKWVDILEILMNEYNGRVHRTTNMTPKDVSRGNEAVVLKRFKSMIRKTKLKPKFKLGDKVRISKYKHIFEKGYTPNWTTEIFTVKRVIRTRPITYHLKDYRNQPISGGFYEQELLKVKNPDVYLVEKVIKSKGHQKYVKWLGFDRTHNSWINK